MVHDFPGVGSSSAESPCRILDQQTSQKVTSLLGHPAGEPDVLRQDVTEHYFVVLQKQSLKKIYECLANSLVDQSLKVKLLSKIVVDMYYYKVRI